MVGVALFADREGEDVLGARGLAGFNEFLDGLRFGNVREGIVRVEDEGFDGVGEAFMPISSMASVAFALS